MSAAEVLTSVGASFPPGWNPERLEFFLAAFRRGESYGWIEKHIGGGLTRNALIGKAWRLGLTGRTASASPQRVNLASARAARALRLAGAPLRIAVVEPEAQARLQLLDLTETTCKFPIGDPKHPSFGFCGKPKDPSAPYCGDPNDRSSHMGIAYKPGTASGRSINDIIRSLGRIA